MRNMLLVLILVLMLAGCTPAGDAYAPKNIPTAMKAEEADNFDPVIEFESEALERLILNSLHRDGGDIHQSDLDAITNMTIVDGITIAINSETENIKPIDDIFPYESASVEYWEGGPTLILNDLRFFSNLESLCLISCKVEDWNGLTLAPSLKRLEINYNDDFNLNSLSTVLFQIKNLTTLDLRFDDIVNISALSGLGVEELILYGNHLQDVDLESPMANLKRLDIGCNDFPVANIRRKDYPNLESLSYKDTNLTQEFKLDALAQFDELVELNLADCRIKDISALASLTKLKKLDLYGSQIIDLSALQRMKELEYLNLELNNVLDISSSRYAWDEKVVDLSPIQFLVNLKQLNISNNAGMLDISSFDTLTKLEVFLCSGGPVYGCPAIENNKGLTKLEITNTRGIKDLSFLEGMTELTDLDISNGEFEDISVLAELSNLKELHIEGNPIVDYSVLEQLDLDELVK